MDVGSARILSVRVDDQEYYDGELVRSGFGAARAEFTYHLRGAKSEENDAVDLRASFGGNKWTGLWRGGFGQAGQTVPFELWR